MLTALRLSSIYDCRLIEPCSVKCGLNVSESCLFQSQTEARPDPEFFAPRGLLICILVGDEIIRDIGNTARYSLLYTSWSTTAHDEGQSSTISMQAVLHSGSSSTIVENSAAISFAM